MPRVFPGVFPIRATSRPRSRFNTLDLPTLDLPTSATAGCPSKGKSPRRWTAATSAPRPVSFFKRSGRGSMRDRASLGGFRIRGEGPGGCRDAFHGDLDDLIHVRDVGKLHLGADLFRQVV